MSGPTEFSAKKLASHVLSGDRRAILIAVLCFVHCVAGPALLSFGSLASLTGSSERLEPAFLMGSLAVGTMTLVPSYRRKHGRLSCLAMFCSGIFCLIVRHHVRWAAFYVDHVGAGIGATLIVGAHALNLRFSRRCRCCEPIHVTTTSSDQDST